MHRGFGIPTFMIWMNIYGSININRYIICLPKKNPTTTINHNLLEFDLHLITFNAFFFHDIRFYLMVNDKKILKMI